MVEILSKDIIRALSIVRADFAETVPVDNTIRVEDYGAIIDDEAEEDIILIAFTNQSNTTRSFRGIEYKVHKETFAILEKTFSK